MVLVVMDFHRLGVDVGFERVEWIGKGRNGVGHGIHLLMVSSVKIVPERSIPNCRKTG
jgi:hypothetical protein